MKLYVKIPQKILLWLCIFIISFFLLELLFAIFSPSPEVKKDLLGREINPFKNGNFPKYETFYHGNQPYHDFSPSQEGRGLFFNEFFVDWRINEICLRESRNPDFTNTDNDVCRILFLGDSQTFGYVPQNQTFCRLLEKKLNSTAKQDVIALNGGVPGYGQYESLWKLIRIIKSIKPDVIIPVVFIDNWLLESGGNDLRANNIRYEHIEKNTVPFLWWENKSQENSLESLFINHFHVARPLALLRRKITGKNTYTLDTIRTYIQSRKMDDGLTEAWDTTINLLQEIRHVGETMFGSKTVILYLPSIESLQLKDNSPYQELRRSKIPVIDMFEVFSAAGTGDNYSTLYYKMDRHYNQYANKLIADKAAEFLMRNHYIASDL